MKVGDYVRTEKGILEIRDDKTFKDDKNKLNYLTYGNYTCVLKENIIKSSPNIIDLIEVGDYVNGSKVKEINNSSENLIYHFVIVDTASTTYNTIFKNEIRSILTKEQFSQMEYKVGE